ncbi:MAG: transglycosylase family protein [Candidatus Dormibacteria bacterium]|jgi:hypothetical protein
MRTVMRLPERAGRRAGSLLRSARHLAPPLRGRGGRIWIPRRLAELVAAIAILPLGAVLTLTVAAFSGPSAAPSQGPPIGSAGSLLRFQIQPLGNPSTAVNSGISTPVLASLPPAPQLAPLQVVDGTEIPDDPYSTAEVEAIITQAADADGVNPAWMIRTATCESTLHTNSYNPSGPYYGLFQFLMSTFKAHGGTDIWDPVQQSEIAASMFASGDSSAWPVCSLA